MSEVRLIDANRLITELWKAMWKYEDETEKQFLESDELDVGDWFSHRIFVQNMSDIDRDVVQNQPTVDAVPAVHGYWRPHPLGYTSNLVKYEEWDVCSNCGIGTKRRNMTDDFFEEYSYSFCPNCGARMKGEQE